MVRCETTPPVLQIPRQLVVLPERYSDLVKQASTFQCPQRSDGREYSDDGQAAMLCLVCGEMLCTNSYCCQKVVEVEGEERSEEDKIRIGGFTQHAQRLAIHVHHDSESLLLKLRSNLSNFCRFSQG
jgi:E3 ubiquitin-protein ligase UBR2